ncbi:NAD(P)/FAD-dependent oxidoreductase [Pseudomonas sp. Choline-3u-10]|uniref:NAD(P)/FAD-dependent oxidoreductase n=1 Tax=Pseudomonadaceae TaxID=135621 RepID=UPI00061F46D9|nr:MULTISPECIES: NAD(P)/FAD-dependent oxidoreductase [unclassified Pseudomonas]MAL37516.1 NAD(P)/FAD-dependent oxidoreductase [Pseudomonas sp.]MBK3793816.1 aminoacetone oxidase family FAD-binding enzyme [Stutzerimonas stutzeri]MBU0951133.1 NAD(P)/FAD-dependent oxidoreductase [Gammaproteobacteria bacterium]KJJ64663.1 membrane protein [Pseudomonas sp. 10B238]MBK3875306.1 aminoacetone oxidase family FAD-binding enzyme [Stutzerimonas stutzeri]
MQTDVVVIGAGAAGLMCAFTAAARGRRVLLIDHANKAGKKILMSGGGRCNFTNLYTEPANFLSGNPHFCKSALARYTQWDFIELVSRHGVPYHEKKLGQLFCDNKASDILGMLLDECEQAGVDLRLETAVQTIDNADDGYQLLTDAGPVTCQSLVIATGGLSIPTLGASGFGYQVARQFGHTVLPTRAGLVPFTITEPQLKSMCEALSGTSVEDCLVSCNGQSFRENILFTHRGLSGPAILQVSSYWEPGDAIEINLLPHLNLSEWLDEQRRERPNTELKTLLGELFTRKMAGLLAEHWFVSKPLKQYSANELIEIGEQLGCWRLVPAGTEGYRTAEVTLGGVDTKEVSSKTMESQKSPGLYFVGEVLDVTGHLGGFNFQWAWASGYAAAQYA